LLPDASKNLIATTELKLFANGLGINKIEAHEDGGRIIFAADPNIDIDQLLGLIQLEPNVFKMNGSEKLSFNVHLEDVDSRINYIRHLINTILVKS
jgi:transcription-repair coupling factor (superfamily II helicase)